MRQLDLKRALLGFGATPKNFKNEPGAVEYLRAPGLLEVALLDRRQRAVHHHELSLMAADEADNLFDLTFAEISRGPDLVDRGNQRVGNRQVDGAREPRSFLEARGGVPDGKIIHARIGVTPTRSQVRAD